MVPQWQHVRHALRAWLFAVTASSVFRGLVVGQNAPQGRDQNHRGCGARQDQGRVKQGCLGHRFLHSRPVIHRLLSNLGDNVAKRIGIGRNVETFGWPFPSTRAALRMGPEGGAWFRFLQMH